MPGHDWKALPITQVNWKQLPVTSGILLKTADAEPMNKEKEAIVLSLQGNALFYFQKGKTHCSLRHFLEI